MFSGAVTPDVLLLVFPSGRASLGPLLYATSACFPVILPWWSWASQGSREVCHRSICVYLPLGLVARSRGRRRGGCLRNTAHMPTFIAQIHLPLAPFGLLVLTAELWLISSAPARKGRLARARLW